MPDEPQYREIGRRLEAVRVSFSSLGKGAWAEKNGFNHTQYSNWISGDRRIPVDASEKLCDRYDLTLDFIYRGKLSGLSENVLNKLESHLPST